MGHFTCNFISYSLNRSVTVNVILPTLTCPEIFAGGKSHEVKESIRFYTCFTVVLMIIPVGKDIRPLKDMRKKEESQ